MLACEIVYALHTQEVSAFIRFRLLEDVHCFSLKTPKSHLKNIHVTNQYPSMKWPIGTANDQIW